MIIRNGEMVFFLGSDEKVEINPEIVLQIKKKKKHNLFRSSLRRMLVFFPLEGAP